jgi:hypothetical protein
MTGRGREEKLEGSREEVIGGNEDDEILGGGIGTVWLSEGDGRVLGSCRCSMNETWNELKMRSVVGSQRR